MTTLVRWSPFRELDLMERRMRRLLDDVGFVPALLPAVDVYETEDEFVLELEVPGYEEKELTIEAFDHTVAIAGDGGRSRRSPTRSSAFTSGSRSTLSAASSFRRRPTRSTSRLSSGMACSSCTLRSPPR